MKNHLRARPFALAGVFLLIGIAPAPTIPAQPATAGAATEVWRAGRSPALLAILDEHLEWMMTESPRTASGRGDERFNDRLEDASPAAYQRRLAAMKDRLARLTALSPADFTDADRTDADLLKYELDLAVRGSRFFNEQTPIDARSGPQVSLPQMADSLPFRTRKHYEDYATRLEQIPRLIDQHIEQMRAGMKAGRVQPKVVMNGTVEQTLASATKDIEETPSLSTLFKPFRGSSGGPGGPEVAARARKAIAEGIVPAFRRLAAFLKDEYIPACRDDIAISNGPDGPAAYDFAVRSFTTMDMTAEQVHALGLGEVARIRAEMFKVIARSDFPRKTELQGDELFKAFTDYLRTDKRFYYEDPEALLAGYRDICKRIDAQLPLLFKKLPRIPYGVRETPAFAAPSSTTAYYDRGSLKAGTPAYFTANTYRLDQRPKYEMVALSLHEAVPGHHLQISLAEEMEDVHPIRTMNGYTAFIEGWALYAERLGLEVEGGLPGESNLTPIGDGQDGGRGFYTDPYVDFGRLTYEMWRATRLVVDTGMHAKDWTRSQAIEFMLANSALSQLNIEREVDRYIAWPGQATAYKVGELKIRELRARAERALGERFDRREFHDAILGAGPLPLPTLEKRVVRWIESAAADSK